MTIRLTLCIAVLAWATLAEAGSLATVPAGAPLATPAGRTCDVRTVGAIGDGITVNTKAIQFAIDQCTATPGGGIVAITGGKFVTGTLYLKSHVTLHVDAGAVLLGSPSIADYTTDTDRTMYRGEPYMDRCLIYVHNADHATIEGPGTIDGQGKSFPNKGDGHRNRPKLLRLLDSTNLRMHDLSLEAPAAWTTEWRYCDGIAVDHVKIHSRANSNGDGLDFDGCTGVRVADSTFDTSDDSICLQTSRPDHPCRDVQVTRCTFSSRWAGLRVGLLSRGDISDLLVTDCTFSNHNDSGVKIQENEGATIHDLTFSRLTMTNVPHPVLVTLCQKNAWVDAGPSLPAMGHIRGLHFDHVAVDTSTGGKLCSFVLTGMPDHPVEDVTFTDVAATFPGGGTAANAAAVPGELTPDVLATHWPEYSSFRSNLPASGLYARHVSGLTLSRFAVTLRSADARRPIVFADVAGSKTSDCPDPDVRP